MSREILNLNPGLTTTIKNQISANFSKFQQEKIKKSSKIAKKKQEKSKKYQKSARKLQAKSI
jgi:hypothetical protein